MKPSWPPLRSYAGSQLGGAGAHVVERQRKEQLLGVALASRRQTSQLVVVGFEPVIAFAKIVGFEVAPVTLKSRSGARNLQKRAAARQYVERD